MKKKIIRFLKRAFWSLEKHARHDGVTMGTGNRIESYFWSSAEPYLITIGDNCDLTEGSRIYTHGSAKVARDKYPDFDIFGKVVLGNRVYVGSRAQIMPGVTIGDNVLIAAGSVVTKSIPSNVVVAGNPARYVCSLDEYIQKNLPFNMNTRPLSPKKKREFLLAQPEERFIRKELIQVCR